MTWHSQPSRRHSQRALLLAFVITLCFLVVEVVGGVLTNSLALLADAGHMLSDVAALGLGMFAIWMAMRPATATRTYGLHRVEILAALANGIILVLIALYIFWQAAERFLDPPEVQSLPMLVVAAAGLGANAASGAILYRHSGGSLNVRAAFLHVLGDAFGSVGVIAAGIVMLTTGWFVADPIISMLIGTLILVSAWRLLRESLGVLLEAAPAHVDAKEVEAALKAVDGVAGVHDLHVWTVTCGFVALTCHVEVDGSCDTQEMLGELCRMLNERYGIRHVTIQPETFEPDRRVAQGPLPRCISAGGGGCGR
ncbi:MAG: cation diffusion facilitator family transporter [Dehalococcoidia bacterium]